MHLVEGRHNYPGSWEGKVAVAVVDELRYKRGSVTAVILAVVAHGLADAPWAAANEISFIKRKCTSEMPIPICYPTILIGGTR